MQVYSAELIAAMIQRCRPDHMAEDLARMMESVRSLTWNIEQAESRIRAAKRVYRDAQNDYRASIEVVQRDCMHLYASHDDYITLGESNNEYNALRCRICGKEIA